MTLEIANRLVELRKQHGLSQEELADKLGVSRQAVSKWERVESSPDTDNLIALAKLYGMSLDNLLNYNPSQKVTADDDAQSNTDGKSDSDAENGANFDENGSSDDEYRIHISDGDGGEVRIGRGGIHISDGDDVVHIGLDGIKIASQERDRIFDSKHKKPRTAVSIFSACAAALIVAGYLVLGAVGGYWHPGWLIFFLVPTFTAKDADELINSFPALIIGGYLALGIFLSAWHPGWVLFAAIPIYYIVVNRIKSAIRMSKVKIDMSANGADNDTITFDVADIKDSND